MRAWVWLSRHGWSWPRLVAVGLALVVVAPVLVAGLNGVARVWFPAGDWAVIETRVLDVGGAHTPLVGPYSRDGWNHPGPLLFWLLAVPYRLSGGHPSSMLLGAALINAVAVVGMLVFAWRRGGLALFGPMAVVLALLLHTIGPALLRDPWNPWVTALPFGLLIVVAWAATEGDRAALPVVAVVGAFTAQSHLAFLPFAAILTVAAGVGFWLRQRRARPLLIGAAVAVICWLPVLAEVVTGGPNTSDLLSYFRAAGDTAGWRASEKVASLELGLPAPWLGAPEPANAAGGGLVGAGLRTLTVPLVVFGVALAVAWWARARPAVRFQLFLAGTAVVGLVSVSRMTGDIYNYLVRWWWALAALLAASVGWSVACGVRRLAMDRGRALPIIRAAAVAVTAAVVVYASSSTISSAGERLPVDDWTPALVDVAAPGADAVPHDRPVYVQATGPLAGWVGDAIAPRLVAAGVDIRVPDVGINRHKWGSSRVVPGPDASMRGAWMVTGSRVQDFRDAHVGTEVASYDPLSPAERLDSTQLERQLRTAYTAAGRQDLVERMDEGVSLWTEAPVPGVDQAVLDRYEAFRRRGVSVALFLTDDATTPAPPRPA